MIDLSTDVGTKMLQLYVSQSCRIHVKHNERLQNTLHFLSNHCVHKMIEQNDQQKLDLMFTESSQAQKYCIQTYKHTS